MIFGSEDKNSADLDKYYSVNFYNPPYGQMIMSSEVVKWLCINKAKDYFDEIENFKTSSTKVTKQPLKRLSEEEVSNILHISNGWFIFANKLMDEMERINRG